MAEPRPRTAPHAATPAPGRVYEYYATCVHGLERVVSADLAQRLPELGPVRTERGRRHGRLSFRYERSPRLLLELGCVTNLFALVARVPQVTTGRPGLTRIVEALAASHLATAVALYGKLHGLDAALQVRLVCTVTPNHRFAPTDVAQAVAAALPPPVTLTTSPSLEAPALHVTVEEHAAVCGLQLGQRRLRRRDYRRAAVGGGLDATVAYCMALLAGAGPGVLCLDPMCGGATVLIEGAQAFGARLGIGGDLSSAALAVARQAAAQAGVPVRLVQWNAAELPVRTAAADALMCNLPFGKRVAALGAGSIDEILAEVARVLRPNGRAALLGHAEDLRTIPQTELREEQRLRLHLRGVDPVLLVLRRR